MRGLLVASLACAGTAWAQPQKPLPQGTPDDFTAPSVRVAVVASEDLNPDLLRKLARRDVTLWLETRSNALRQSTLENLGRFDEAFVRFRAPLGSADARVFERWPKVGLWLDVGQLAVLGRLPGARRVAVDVSGPLTKEVADRVAGARPSLVRWAPTGPIDVLEWGLFRQLPGRKVVRLPPESLRAVSCVERLASVALEIDVATLLTMNSDVFPCGSSTRVVIRPGVDAWLLQSLVVREPALELVLDVGADEKLAAAARGVLDTVDRRESR